MSGQSRLALGISLVSFICLCGLFFAVRMWMPFMWGFVVPAVLGLAFWLYKDRTMLLEFFTMKSTKQGLNMGALILIVLALLTMLNYLGAKYYKVYDLSANKINTLSDQSLKLLSQLDSPIQLKFFYKNATDGVEDNKKAFRDLVKKYQDVSPNIQISFYEMNENAKLAQDYGVTRGTGEAFLEYNGNRNRIEKYSEQDLTNTIIKVTRKSKKNIYIVEGHDERNTDQERDETGLFGFKQLLEKNSYQVAKLSLAGQKTIPADAHALLILGPRQNFLKSEIESLQNYLERGGSVFIAFDNKNSAGLQDLIGRFGVQLEKFYVFNVYDTPMGQVVNAQSPTVAVNYSTQHSATKLFGTNQMTVFSQPSALRILPAQSGMTPEVLVKTPANSVALLELDSKDYSGQPQSFNLGVEVKGKLGKSDKEATLIVFSDVDFMSNLLLYQNLNRDLALNTVAALVKEDDLISISPKEPLMTRITLAPPEVGQFLKFVILGLFLPIPIAFMSVSFVLWYRRRHA